MPLEHYHLPDEQLASAEDIALLRRLAQQDSELDAATSARLLAAAEAGAIEIVEGEKDNVYIAIVDQRVILVIIFDEHSSLGLVRLRVRKATQDLERIFVSIQRKVEEEKERRHEGVDSPFAEITDEDIDSLFRE